MENGLFDQEEITTETLKDSFRKIDGFAKTINVTGHKYPTSITYTISKGELIITKLTDGPYKASTVSWIAGSSEIWTFFNKYAPEMDDYYGTLGK